MSHPNAALTPRHRLIVAQLVVDQGWPISEVAARFQVSWPTVKRWADRYRTGQSMQDRTSRGYVNSIRPRDDGPTWPQLTRDQQHRAFRGCPLRGWCP